MPEKGKKFKTNSKKGSTAKVAIKVVTFKEIWDAYPSDAPVHLDPGTKKDIYKDHCAIKVGEALLNAGISMRSFAGGKCHCCPRKDRQRHPLLAQAVADWLSGRPFPGCPVKQKSDGAHYKKDFGDKTGIIFFKDYWQRDREKGTSGRSGDHIDLWNDRTLASLGAFESVARINLGMHWDGLFSDYDLSREVLFWEIK